MQLQRFARLMFQLSDWPNGGDIDGFAFQDAAVECGLLIRETRYEPCGDSCHCAESFDLDEMRDGVLCYRKAPFLTKGD